MVAVFYCELIDIIDIHDPHCIVLHLAEDATIPVTVFSSFVFPAFASTKYFVMLTRTFKRTLVPSGDLYLSTAITWRPLIR